MSHNPNPFDFVPFDENGPQLKTLEEWLKAGNLRTGRISVAMKALTPVHIVGEQPMNGKNIEESRFYKRGDKYFIPGSSIRGVLRAFIEAACNGWASQLTPFYQEEKKKHTYGFKVVKSDTPDDAKISPFLSDICSIDQKFTVPASAEKGIDLSSFLFGYIPGKQVNKDDFNSAWKSRIIIDDAAFDGSMLSSVTTNDSYRIPDLDNNNSNPDDKDKDPRAFMGGPHPSASSWWYQFPKEIRKNKYGAYKFIGSGFRGRKFYFHQDPVKCISYYKQTPEWQKNSNGIKKLHFFPIECLNQGESVMFDLIFNGIPEELLYLLCFALEPGINIRHKIGYGKAYGYGSVEFSIEKVEYKSKGFEEQKDVAIDEIRASIGEQFKAFSGIKTEGFTQFLDKASLDHLSFILWYDSKCACIFTYPFAGSGGFNVDLNNKDRNDHNHAIANAAEYAMNSIEMKIPSKNAVTGVSPDQGKKMSQHPFLFISKPTLHFEVYQEKSIDNCYNTLRKKRIITGHV
jgi:CRISPR/Cas system CSM-associated protein Csm3 (group 7 of RAMP superfamily)